MCTEEISIQKPTGGVCQYWGRLDCAGVMLSGRLGAGGSGFVVSRMCISLNFCIVVIIPAVLQVLLSKRMAISSGVSSGSLARRLIFILPWEVIISISSASEDDGEASVVESSSER